MPEECVTITQHVSPEGLVTYTWDVTGDSLLCSMDVTQIAPEDFPNVLCVTQECPGECREHVQQEGPPVWVICCQCGGT